MPDAIQDGHVQIKPVPIITCDADLADSAYLVYAAMKRAEIECPALLNIPLWNAYKAGAWAWFNRAFDVL